MRVQPLSRTCVTSSPVGKIAATRVTLAINNAATSPYTRYPSAHAPRASSLSYPRRLALETADSASSYDAPASFTPNAPVAPHTAISTNVPSPRVRPSSLRRTSAIRSPSERSNTTIPIAPSNSIVDPLAFCASTEDVDADADDARASTARARAVPSGLDARIASDAVRTVASRGARTVS